MYHCYLISWFWSDSISQGYHFQLSEHLISRSKRSQLQKIWTFQQFPDNDEYAKSIFEINCKGKLEQANA